jgi:hypothetical protein
VLRYKKIILKLKKIKKKKKKKKEKKKRGFGPWGDSATPMDQNASIFFLFSHPLGHHGGGRPPSWCHPRSPHPHGGQTTLFFLLLFIYLLSF